MGRTRAARVPARSRRWSAAVVAVALLVTGCQRLVFRVDHEVAHGRAVEPAPVDPASGALTRAWQARVEGSIDDHYVLAAGQLLVISREGVSAYATSNGAARWHYGEGKVDEGSGWSCVHHLEPHDAYEVKVAWVARDAADADRMLDPAGTSARPIPALGDEAYTPGRDPERVVLRVGRYITVIDGLGGADPKIMAEAVARDLERLGH